MRKILLLDADSLIYICSVKETLTECIAEFNYRFNKIIEYTKATEYVGYITHNNCFRYQVSLSYKANRKSSEAPKWLKALKEYAISQYGFRGHHGLEADDLVGLAKTYYNNLNIDNVIGAIDKDVLKQIPGTHFNYRFDKDTEDFVGEIVTSEDEALRFLFTQAIIGDSVDGIKGALGIGIAKATKYLDVQQCESFEDYTNSSISLYEKVYKNQIHALKYFVETFRLVYILRTQMDYEYEMNNPLLTNDIFDSYDTSTKIENW